MHAMIGRVGGPHKVEVRKRSDNPLDKHPISMLR